MLFDKHLHICSHVIFLEIIVCFLSCMLPFSRLAKYFQALQITRIICSDILEFKLRQQMPLLGQIDFFSIFEQQIWIDSFQIFDESKKKIFRMFPSHSETTVSETGIPNWIFMIEWDRFFLHSNTFLPSKFSSRLHWKKI